MSATTSQPLFNPPAEVSGSTIPPMAMPPLNLAASSAEKRDFAAELRKQTVACRLRREKLGTRKALTREQIKTAAGEFDADAKFLSASKRLLDTKDPAYKAVTTTIRRAVSFWKSLSTPYPEPGVRLIRKDRVELFNSKLTELAAELNQKVADLQERYAALRMLAQDKLGELFDSSDYPNRIDGEFSLDWDFPPIDAPEHLKQLHPELYARECERVKSRFEEAVRLTEQALAAKFAELVSHLADRLKGDVDGKPKTFQKSSIDNLKSFFDEFRNLDLGSSGQLQKLVDQAQKCVGGLSADDVRTNDALRTKLGSELSQIQSAMDGLMVSKPSRAIDLNEEEDQ